MSKVQLIKVTKDDNDIRLDKWFKRHYPLVSHIALEKALRKGNIRVNGKKVKAGYRVIKGDEVRVPPLPENNVDKLPKSKFISEDWAEKIVDYMIYKDDHIIAINKPQGLAVQGGTNIQISVDDLLIYLKFELNEKPKLVHRIDKDTSGILILARSANVAAQLAADFKNREMDKTYLAVVAGNLVHNSGTIDLPLSKMLGHKSRELMTHDEDGMRAITKYRVIASVADKLSLVELKPITGRTHQLRVHMALIGNPIIGDGKYGKKDVFLNSVSRKLCLHAWKIKLNILGNHVRINAPLPEHMEGICQMFDFKI